MKNAGELSVRGMLILSKSSRLILLLLVTTIDANGELKVESGTYRKMDLCKRHDVDVGIDSRLDLPVRTVGF